MKKSTYAVASVIAILAFIIYLFFRQREFLAAIAEIWLRLLLNLVSPTLRDIRSTRGLCGWQHEYLSLPPRGGGRTYVFDTTALTLGFVYLIVRRLGSSASAGLFAVLMLGGNYLFSL